MYKVLSPLIGALVLLASDAALGLSCATESPESILKNYKTVFAALVLEGHFIEGEGVEECGWVEGAFEVIEEFKGNAASVKAFRQRIHNCAGARIAGASDGFPIGKYVLVKTNNEIAQIGPCSSVWDEYEASCLIDGLRRDLNRDALNLEVRESCVGIEESRTQRSRAQGLREYRTYLEEQIAEFEAELEKTKEALAEEDLSEQ
jgi:hypothetical protein